MAGNKFEFQYIFGFIASIFFIHIIGLFLNLDYSAFCLVPRKIENIFGVLTMPLLHENFEHLFSNLFSFFIVSFVLFSIYARVAKWVFWMGYFFTGLLVWFIGRDNSCHIGASGLVYCISFFLMMSGIIRKDITSLIAAIIVIFFNQGLIAGMLPLQSKISWEGHLSGAIVGTICAIIFRNIDRKKAIKHQRTKTIRRRFFEDFDE